MDQSSFIEARKIMSSIWSARAFTNQKVCRIAEIYGLDHTNADFNVIMVSLADQELDSVNQAEKELIDLKKELEKSVSTIPNETKGGKRCCA